MTVREAMEFILEYYQGKFPGQRLGQAFVNQHVQGADPELFYVEDDKVAQIEIYNRAVEDETIQRYEENHRYRLACERGYLE